MSEHPIEWADTRGTERHSGELRRREDGNRKTRKAIDRAHLANASPGGQTLRHADAVHNLHNLNVLSPAFAKLNAAGNS